MILKTAACGLVFLFLISTLFAQDLSNKGKDFWVVYAGHFDGTTSRMALYITSDQNASGTVDVSGNSIPFTVSANQVTTVQLTNNTTPSNSLVYNAQAEGIGARKGIHINSDKPVAVYAHILNAARSGSTLVLPTHVLGKEYYVSSYKSTSPGPTRRSQFDVIATIDNTTIEITPTKADANGTHAANVPFQITLSKGDVYQYQSDEDLTGTHIKAIGAASTTCQPIAVFSGSTFTAMGCAAAGTGDNLYQQLFPFSAWGKTYYTAPFINRAYDIYRILVQDPAELVYVNGVALNPSLLIAGRYYEINTMGNNTSRIISSNKPICVFQYLVTQGCDGVNSDPEMIVLNPIEQTLNDITVMSARRDLTPPNTNITNHYLNIIFKTNTFNSLKVDGIAPKASPIAIGGTPYSYIQEDVTASTSINPAHRITSDSGFICIAYGYGNVESYGYNAGANVKDLYQFVSIQNQYAVVDFPATCRNTPFTFAMTFPYQPTQIKWLLGPIGYPDVTIIAPVYDSSYVLNGKTLYTYKLLTTYSISKTGTYPIKVLAQNPSSDGCGDEQEILYDLEVYERPSADFVFNGNICLGNGTQFTDKSNGNNRPVTKWLWEMGDNSSAITKDPAHLYTTVGNFDARHSVITDIGCVSDTTTKKIQVYAVPTSRFTIPSINCATKDMAFTDQSVVSEGKISKWVWNLGTGGQDDILTTNTPLINQYPLAGSYKITLKTETDMGCASPVFDTMITIHPQPIAGFAMSANCLIDPYSEFTDTSRINGGSIKSWLWNFGDADAVGNANTSVQQSPKHKFAKAVTYMVSQTITSDKGCTATLTQPFTINGSQPQPGFQLSGGNTHCSNDTIVLTNNAVADVGKIVKLEIWWDYGNNPSNKITDNNPVVGKQYRFNYPEFFTPVTKTYIIKLMAYSGINCWKDSTITVDIKNMPAISFSALDAICGNALITQFSSARVTNGIGGQGVYSGDGTATNGLFNPVIAGPGTHTIRYTHTGANGCSNYQEQPVLVYPAPIASAGPDKILLEGGFETLNGMGSGSGINYKWTPAQWLNSDVVPEPKTSATDDVVYKLIVTSSEGCMATDDVMVKVLKGPSIPNVFTPNGDGINDRWEIKYLETYPDASVMVYNRYGQLTFRSKGYSKPWDGMFNGKPVPAGTYYYIVSPGSGRKQMSGFVDIVR